MDLDLDRLLGREEPVGLPPVEASEDEARAVTDLLADLLRHPEWFGDLSPSRTIRARDPETGRVTWVRVTRRVYSLLRECSERWGVTMGEAWAYYEAKLKKVLDVAFREGVTGQRWQRYQLLERMRERVRRLEDAKDQASQLRQHIGFLLSEEAADLLLEDLSSLIHRLAQAARDEDPLARMEARIIRRDAHDEVVRGLAWLAGQGKDEARGLLAVWESIPTR